MTQFCGKTAVISGGAEGIGFSIATALGQHGMNIVLADLDAAKLAEAESKLQALKVPVLAVIMDVTKPDQWQATADRAVERFGKIHMLVNNAGVSTAPGPIEKTSHKDWQWVVDVNLMGVIYGTEIMVPLIKQHGEGGWLLNVASMAGMTGIPYAGAYTATKVAVVGMSESWQVELSKHNIHVAVLCPAFVKTRIHLSHRNRQENYTRAESDAPPGKNAANIAAALVENGIPAELVGQRVLEALKAGEFYIFTHPRHRESVQRRFQRIDEAFERAEQSLLVKDIQDEPATLFE